jgi:signal transduction histidine kinase
MKFPAVQIPVTPGTGRRRALVQIHWFVVITCSLLFVIQHQQSAQNTLGLVLLVALLGSMLVFLWLPEAAFMHRFFGPVMAVLDTVFIYAAIIVNPDGPWDLCLVFLFGVLIAAVGENLLQTIAVCLLAGFLSIVLITFATGSGFSPDADTLTRIALILASVALFGYLADQLRQEKRKVAELEQNRREKVLTKDQFFSNVSHELRTPLTAVYQFVTIVLDGLAGNLTAEQKQYLEIALRNVKQLQAMVGDLLEAARAESGKLAIHPRGVSLKLSVEETLGTFSANAREKGIELTEDLPGDLPLLYVDPRRLKQILTNLVDNALKFTPKNGRVTVRATALDGDRDFIRVSVSDTGCGISAGDTERIFNRLFQVENSSDTNRNGLGLGLHITKELVVRHGGSIWAESKPASGATFNFTMPVFSLKRLLQLLLQEEGQPITSLSLISVELLHNPSSPLEVAKAIQEMAWLTLNAMELPQRTALFPNIVLGGERGLFHVLQAKDLESSSELASRIEKEIARSKQFRNANCQVRTVVSPIELTQAAQGIDIETLSAQIDARISQAMSVTKHGAVQRPELKTGVSDGNDYAVIA